MEFPLSWTEDNRLRTVADPNHYSYYQYDASGERTCKLTWSGNWSNINGTGTVYYLPEGGTLYASPYLVITLQGYTKHYYAEAERITSQLGRGQFADVGTPVVSDSLMQVKLQAVTADVAPPATLTEPDSTRFAYLDTLTNRQDAVSTLYFYHPDHLGSSSWITTTNGVAVQHLHYLPWGEDFVNQRTGSFSSMYTFSAKEKDMETGYSYFGSRYYSSDLSIWLSVDPMSDKYPSLSPYVYCADNPVKLVDPNGEEVWHPDGEGGLIGDKGDDYSTLKQYLSTIYGSQSAISQDNWNNFENQINNYQTQNDTRDAEGIRLHSSDGVFNNLVGKYLMTMCQADPMWGLGPYESNNCSPTTFNRVDKATEFVYGVDLLGEIEWKNNCYKAWQGCGPNNIAKFGTGVVVEMNLGFQVANSQSDLQQGAILGLVGKSAWHSAFFIDYIYDGSKKIGFKYWDQNDPYIHDNLFENDTYKIRKGVNFK